MLEIPELMAGLDHAKAVVRRSQDELKRAQDDFERAKSAHEVAHLEYSCLAEVSKTRPGLVAQQEIDDAQGRDREAEAQVAASQAGRPVAVVGGITGIFLVSLLIYPFLGVADSNFYVAHPPRPSVAFDLNASAP